DVCSSDLRQIISQILEGGNTVDNVISETATAKRTRTREKEKLSRTWPLHIMILPAAIVTFIFAYMPMGGLVMAFQDFKPYDGIWDSKFVGLTHFNFMFEYPDSKEVIWNTLIISGLKIVFGLIVPFIFAILLNEIRKMMFKRVTQT